MTSSLTTSVYNTVTSNETNGAAQASKLSPPLPTGTSGWTIGAIQLDFNNRPSQAQATLVDALVASGDFSNTEAQSIATAFTSAKRSSSVNLSGATDIFGDDVTVASAIIYLT